MKNIAYPLLIVLFSCNANAKQEITYHITTQDGSVLKTVSAEGVVESSYRYAPFGEKLVQKDLMNQRAQQCFLGGIHEAKDLTYLKHRYYNTVIGRFYQPDPVTYMDGGLNQINRYQYAVNDPFTFMDPNGLVIKVAGGGESRQNYLLNLQELDPSVYFKTHSRTRVTTVHNDGGYVTPGNKLLTKLINSNQSLTLATNINDDFLTSSLKIMQPSNPLVSMDFSHQLKLREMIADHTFYVTAPHSVLLAHELVHALDGMEGVYDPSYITYTVLGTDGLYHDELFRKSEYRAVGVAYQRYDGLSENAIRKQLGYPVREGYLLDTH